VIILDTCVVIGILHGRPHPQLPALVRPVVAAITVAELSVGVERAHGAVRTTRAAVVGAFLDHALVLDYTGATARTHATLLAHTATAGAPRGAHDLMIAAHAAEHDATIITTDARARFGELPGVDVRLLEAP
jgi:tRNA(fMet)-specific endonuclease VapC